MKVTEVLSKDEIQELIRPADWRGWLAVLTTWGMIAASLTAVAFLPSVWTVLAALVILGGRHLALAILMHDAAHCSLFKTRWLNDWVGAWLCAYPTWQDLRRYRPHHLRHHQYAGSEKDPDIDLVTAYPVSRASLARKLLRDLVGLTALKRVYGLLLMDLGYIGYTVSSRVERLSQEGMTPAKRLRLAWRNLHGVAISNLALLALFTVIGHPWLYLLWAGSYLTTFSVFLRIRSIAEHACTEMDLDPLKNTRTTYANWLARVTVAPHFVNYHLEHHLLMTVPHQNFKCMHQLLLERGALRGAFVARGYLTVLASATERKSR